MKARTVKILGVFSLFSSCVYADEKYDHFPSLDAPSTEVALCNLAAYNKKLAHITSKKTMTTEDMLIVHELTYTLENAVIRLQENLKVIAEDLEKVHKASEHLNTQIISDSGKAYLSATELLLAPTTCP